MVSASKSLSETVRGGKNSWVNSTASASASENTAAINAALKRPKPTLLPHSALTVRKPAGMYKIPLAIQSARLSIPNSNMRTLAKARHAASSGIMRKSSGTKLP